MASAGKHVARYIPLWRVAGRCIRAGALASQNPEIELSADVLADSCFECRRFLLLAYRLGWPTTAQFHESGRPVHSIKHKAKSVGFDRAYFISIPLSELFCDFTVCLDGKVVLV